MTMRAVWCEFAVKSVDLAGWVSATVRLMRDTQKRLFAYRWEWMTMTTNKTITMLMYSWFSPEA